jgi:hypothetical protein
MAEQLEIEEQPDNIFEKAILPDEETPDITVELETAPDPRLEEQGLSEFESLLMADESRLIESETPEYSEEEEIPEPEPSGIGAYGLQALGGLMDTIHNLGDMMLEGAEDMNPGVAETVEKINTTSDHLVFNFKGLDNFYDPEKPALYFMEANEWNKKQSEGKITHWPTTKKSDDTGQQLTRSLTNVISGLLPANRIVKGIKAGALAMGVAKKAPSSKVVKGLQKFADISSVGTIGSVFSFKPHEPRMSDSMANFVEDTPFEVTQPFFEWMQSSDDNSETEERFLIALESILTDATLVGAYSTFVKVFKRERKLLKAETAGATPEELKAINDLEINSINSSEIAEVIHPPSRTPIKQEAKAQVTKIRKVADDAEEFVTVGDVDNRAGKLVLEASTLSEKGVTNVVKNIARAMSSGEEIGPSAAMSLSGRDPLINLNIIDDVGVKNIVNAISNEIDREAALLGKVLTGADGTPLRVGQTGTKKFSQAEKEGLSYANYIRNASGFHEQSFKNLADTLSIPEKQLFTLMQADRLMADQIGSRTLGWQMVLEDLTGQFQASLRGKDFNDEFVQLMAEKHIATITKLHEAFSEIPRGIARGLAFRRIKMKKEYLNKNGKMKADAELSEFDVLKRNKFLKKQLHGRGMNKQVLESIERIMGVTTNPRARAKALKKALEGTSKGAKALQEVYRGMLLANLKSLTTNLLGNMMETMLIPTAKTIGHIATFNAKGVKEEIGFVFNMLMSTKKATLAGFDALIHERNLLDPLRTKAETPSGDAIRGFYMQMDKAVDAGYWHPQNWVPLVVNSFGKVARGSLRVLGAQDEFFKMLTYNGKAMSKITKAMPDNLSRAQKKTFIKKNLDHFFDDTGEAIDRDLIEYSRRATFQESLEKGHMNNFHQFIDKHPMTWGLIFPFVRTPANLVSRFIQRTPVANFVLSKRTRDMWNSGDKDQVAEVIGNTIMGVGLYSAAISYSMSGNITGAGPVDREKNALWRAAGFTPFTVKVDTPWGPKMIKYDRLEPSALPFLYIATLHENLYRFREDPDSLEDAVGLFIATTAKTLTDRTWLRGVKSFMDGVDGAIENEDISYFATSMGKNFIPAIVSQVHRLSGIAEEDTGAYAFRQAITWQERMMAKLPPMEGYDAIKYNWLTGKPMMLPTGSDFGLDTYHEEPNKYMRELLSFGQVIQPVSKKMGQIELSSDQYSRLNELTGNTTMEGRTLMEAIEDLMDSPEYDFDENRSYHPDFPSPQTRAVKGLVNAYKEKARYDLLEEDDALFNAWQDQETEKAQVGGGLFG